MNRLTGRNELILHQHSPRQPLGSFSGHPGGFRSYVVRACEVFWVFRVWELDLVNVCGEIPCNRRWLLKPSSSPPRWFFWPAETRTEDNVSVWTTGKERGSERSYKSHYNAEKPCTPPPHPAPCVCVRCFSQTLSPFVCARVPSAPCPGGSRAPAAALRCRWGPDRGKGLFLHQPPCPYTLHVEHKQFLHKHTLYLLTFQPHVTLNQHLHLLWSLASRFGRKYLLNEFNRIY